MFYIAGYLKKNTIGNSYITIALYYRKLIRLKPEFMAQMANKTGIDIF